MRDTGFFAVGIEHGKNVFNVGTLWRSAYILGAAFIFTVGRRYRHQASDTVKAWRHIPLLHFGVLDDLYEHLPHDTLLVGVEMTDQATPLREFTHPKRAVYLLGAEDHGLTAAAIDRCQRVIVLPGRYSMNVSVAGSIVIYDRLAKAAA